MKSLLVLFLTFLFAALAAQAPNTLHLEDALKMAIANDPQGGQRQLLEEATQIRIDVIDKDRLPQIAWESKANLQSEAITLPFTVPGQEPVKLPIYSVQTYLKGSYLIFDGGLNEVQKELETYKLATDQQAINVGQRQLKDQVNQVFFSVLLQQEQLKTIALAEKNLNLRYENLSAGLNNGVVLESDVLKMRAEILKLKSREGAIDSNIRAGMKLLESLCGKTFADSIQLQFPLLADELPLTANERPELELFRLQKEQLLSTEKLLAIRQKPKLSAYVQAGIGYPNPLNFFDDTVSPFAVGGLQFTWPLWDWHKSDRERELLGVQAQIIDNQKETFVHRLDLQDGKYLENLQQLRQLIREDQELAALMATISQQTEAQLTHGIITTNEYLLQVNAELDVQLQMQLHQLQLHQLVVEYYTLKGLL